MHQALPELHPDDIVTEITVLGRTLRAPLFISAMTGGTEEAAGINRNLALAAQRTGVAMVLGSQRPAVEDPSLESTYRVREWAPDILLFANLGAVQLNRGYGLEECRERWRWWARTDWPYTSTPAGDATARGDRDFRGLAGKIAAVVRDLGLPVLVKEVGWGSRKGSPPPSRSRRQVPGRGRRRQHFLSEVRGGEPLTRALAAWPRHSPTGILPPIPGETRSAAPDAFMIASGGFAQSRSGQGHRSRPTRPGSPSPLEPACRSADDVIEF